METDAKITLDDCERFHKLAISIVEDIDYDYLEVSSRGADRRLDTDGDIIQGIGSGVDVRLFKLNHSCPKLGKKFQGVIVSAKYKDGTKDVESILLDTVTGMVDIPKREIAVMKLAVAMPDEAGDCTND